MRKCFVPTQRPQRAMVFAANFWVVACLRFNFFAFCFVDFDTAAPFLDLRCASTFRCASFARLFAAFSLCLSVSSAPRCRVLLLLTPRWLGVLSRVCFSQFS